MVKFELELKVHRNNYCILNSVEFSPNILLNFSTKNYTQVGQSFDFFFWGVYLTGKDTGGEGLLRFDHNSNSLQVLEKKIHVVTK